MRRPLTLLLAALLGVGATARSATAGGEGDGLVLASLAPETGSLAPILQSLRRPVQVAVEEINAAGGVNGQDVTLVTGDEDDTTAIARATVDRFAEEHVDAIEGPAVASTTLAVLPAVERLGMLMCSGSDSLSPVDDSGGLYFRTAPPSRLEGFALAELLLSDGHRRVAIIRRRDFFGNGIAKALSQRLRRGGGHVAANLGYDPDATTFTSQVRRALTKHPDAVAVLGFDVDGAAVVRELLASTDAAERPGIYVPDTMQTPKFASTVDPAVASTVAGIKGVAPAAAPYDVDSPFHETFAATGIDPVFSSHYYDCTILTALAAVKAQSTDADAMKDAFVENLRGDEDCNTFAECKKLLEHDKSIHWRGASSNFDSFGDFEPNEGVYDTWSYGPDGQPVTGDPSEQIRVP